MNILHDCIENLLAFNKCKDLFFKETINPLAFQKVNTLLGVSPSYFHCA